MSERTITKKRNTMQDSPTGFDVTCVIGRVEFDNTGEHTPHEAAFLLIAKHDAPGEYVFPNADGGTCRVSVDYSPVSDQTVEVY